MAGFNTIGGSLVVDDAGVLYWDDECCCDDDCDCAFDLSFSAVSTGGSQACEFTFTPTITPTLGTPENCTYAWDFGDGTTSDLESPVHTFDPCNVYTVTLDVSCGCCSNTAAEDVDCIDCVTHSPTVADIRVGNAGNCLVCFSATIEEPCPVDTWEWRLDGAFLSNDQSPCVQFDIADDGSGHTIELIITDTAGCTDTLSEAFNVQCNAWVCGTCDPNDRAAPAISLTLGGIEPGCSGDEFNGQHTLFTVNTYDNCVFTKDWYSGYNENGVPALRHYLEVGINSGLVYARAILYPYASGLPEWEAFWQKDPPAEDCTGVFSLPDKSNMPSAFNCNFGRNTPYPNAVVDIPPE